MSKRVPIFGSITMKKAPLTQGDVVKKLTKEQTTLAIKGLEHIAKTAKLSRQRDEALEAIVRLQRAGGINLAKTPLGK